MTLTDYVNNLRDERAELVKRIMEITLASASAVSRWINGESIPSKVRREIISRELNIPEEQLFPQKEDVAV